MWHGRLGKIRGKEHMIYLRQDAAPVRYIPYRSGYEKREFTKQQIDKMLKEGVVDPLASEYSSPTVLSPNADGSLCFCVDFRWLNAVTKRYSYPFP